MKDLAIRIMIEKKYKQWKNKAIFVTKDEADTKMQW